MRRWCDGTGDADCPDGINFVDRRPMPSGVPPQLLGFLGGVEETLGLVGSDGAVEAAVDHQEWAAGELTDGAQWVGNGADDRGEWEPGGKVATGGEDDSPAERLLRGDDHAKEAAERVAEERESRAVDRWMLAENRIPTPRNPAPST